MCLVRAFGQTVLRIADMRMVCHRCLWEDQLGRGSGAFTIDLTSSHMTIPVLFPLEAFPASGAQVLSRIDVSHRLHS